MSLPKTFAFITVSFKHLYLYINWKAQSIIYNHCKYTHIYYFFFFFLIVYKNEWINFNKSINFNNKNIKKSEFYSKNKKIFNIDDIDANKILISKKETYGKYNSFKYFIGYNDNDVIRPLYLFISQTTGYINKFDKNKMTISLMIKDMQLLKNYNKIWKKKLKN